MHGPKGVGVLIARRDLPIAPQIYGGGHERGIRSGTLNTPGIVGLGVAADLAGGRLGNATSLMQLRDRLQRGLTARVPDVTLIGHPTKRLPNTVNLRFAGADAEAVMASLERVACSAGSACHAGAPEPSHVLLAMGVDREAAYQCLRFSLSRTTTQAEIDAAIDEVAGAVKFVRKMETVAVG